MSPGLAGRFFTTEPPGKPRKCSCLSSPAQLCWMVTDSSHNPPFILSNTKLAIMSLRSKPVPSHSAFVLGGAVLEKHSLQLKLSWRLSPSVTQFCPQKVTCSPPLLLSPHQQLHAALRGDRNSVLCQYTEGTIMTKELLKRGGVLVLEDARGAETGGKLGHSSTSSWLLK